MKLLIASAANRVHSMPICEILFQLLDYSMVSMDNHIPPLLIDAEPATESLKKTVLPWLVQLISPSPYGYDAPFLVRALQTLSKLLNKDGTNLFPCN
jgi:hypothetical protein